MHRSTEVLSSPNETILTTIIIIIMYKKNDVNNNKDNWNYLKNIQKIFGQHTGTPRHQAATENSHTGHCTHLGIY
jgi:hypothetical protein